MHSISLHKLHILYFQFSGVSSSSTSSASNEMVFRSATAIAGVLDCRGNSRRVLPHFQRHATSNPWIGRLLFFLRCATDSAGRWFLTYSRIFALLEQDCRKPPSKDGFLTLEYRPKPLAGHLYGLAKIVTGGRSPKSKPSLLLARTAAGNSSTA